MFMKDMTRTCGTTQRWWIDECSEQCAAVSHWSPPTNPIHIWFLLQFIVNLHYVYYSLRFL